MSKKNNCFLISLFLICFFSYSISAASSASDTAVISFRNTNNFSPVNCSHTAPTNIINGSTFSMVCSIFSNKYINFISIKSLNGGKFLNQSNPFLSERPYTASYNLTVFQDSITDTALDAADNLVTTTYTKVYDVNTKLDGGVKNIVLGVTLNATFTIEDGKPFGDTTDTIYVGTYSDTIFVKILDSNDSVQF